jgi:hypothetical protein
VSEDKASGGGIETPIMTKIWTLLAEHHLAAVKKRY